MTQCGVPKVIDDSGTVEEGFAAFIVALRWIVYVRIRFSVWETMQRSDLNLSLKTRLR